MKKIVKKTVKKAKEYLSNYGFNDKKIEEMIELSISDMNKILDRLEQLLQNDKLDKKDTKKQLHALKGLVSQLHNLKLAKKIEQIENNIKREDLKKLLSE